MAYITTEDLMDELGEELLIQLTDNQNTGEIDEARIAKAIQSAQGVCENYLRLRYTLPVPATAMVKTVNTDIAVYHLFKGRASFDEGVYKVRKNAYDDAVKLLIAISQGKAALDVPAVEETIASPTTGDQILTNANKSKFNDRTLSGF